MLTGKKVAATLLAAAVAGSALAGCGQSTADAMEIDGVTIPAGLYIYYSYAAYYEMTSTLSEEDEDLDISDDKAVKALQIDGVSTEDWVKNKALEYCQSYAAVINECEACGVELSADEKTEIKETIDSFWESYGESYEANGMASSSVQLMLEESYLESDLFYYYYELGGELDTQEDDVWEYYVDNNARVRYIRISKTDGDGNVLDEDGEADLLTIVEGYLEELEGASGNESKMMAQMDDVQEEYDAYVTSISEEAAAATNTDEDGNLITTTAAETTTTEETTTTTETTTEETQTATESTETVVADDATAETTTTVDEESTETETEATKEDTDTETTTETTEEIDPYAYETVISRVTTDEDTDPDSVSYSPCEPVYKEIFGEDEDDEALAFNTPILVDDEDNSAFYLVVRFDIENRMTEDDLWSEDNINSTISYMYFDEFEDMVQDWCDDQNVELNDRAIKRYDAFDIDLDY